MKKYIIIILFLLFLLPAVILFLKNDSTERPGGTGFSAGELPHKVSCNKDLEYDNSIFFNPDRTDKEIKNYLTDLTKVCLEKEDFCPMQGFLVEIYRNNPDKIDGWLEGLDIRSIQQVQALIVPLNTKENIELYQKYVQKNLKDPKQQRRYMGHTPLEDMDFMMQIPCHVEFFWGRYYANQNTKYLDKLLSCAGDTPDRYCMVDGVTKQLIKDSLAKAAEENEEIKAYLEKKQKDLKAEE